jgi:hypothetical protein
MSRQLQYVGTPGIAGVALLVFAVAFFLGANSVLKNEVVELRSNLDEAQRLHGRSASRAIPSQSTELETFVRTLPVRADLPKLTEKIVATAGATGITLERGTYDVASTHSGRLVRARMTFPVHGPYPAIRRFVDSTLTAIPSAAVDGLRLGRKDIGAAEIDADIRFAIYVRASP